MPVSGANAMEIGEVPRHHDADHADRLRNDPGARERILSEVEPPLLRLHPPAQVLDRVEDALLVEQALGEQGLESRPVAVVAVHGLDQRSAILDQQPMHGTQVRDPLLVARIRVR